MYHVAYVSTTLTSPNGRQAHLDVRSAHNSVREDVYLPFDENDLGEYWLESIHDAFCYLANAWIFYEVVSHATARACDFVINGAANPTCDAHTLNYTVYQAAISGGCTAVPFPYGSNLTFGVSGSVDPNIDKSSQNYEGVPPTLDAAYYAGPGPGAVIPNFTIKFAEAGNTRTKQKTDPVCQ